MKIYFKQNFMVFRESRREDYKNLLGFRVDYHLNDFLFPLHLIEFTLHNFNLLRLAEFMRAVLEEPLVEHPLTDSFLESSVNDGKIVELSQNSRSKYRCYSNISVF